VPTTTTTTTAGTTREQQAEALFARANAQRTAGSYERALSSYAQLTLAFPETRSGLAAHISRADLLLRRVGRPQAALAAYRAYLTARRAGALAEEARVGVAISLQRLGRQDEERTAWLELLEHHPGSLHGARARARLHALSR
jgi:tetratricopeptide (TPR) repeat protein